MRARTLFLYIREEPHEARAFDGGFYRALLLGGEACATTTYDAAVRIYKLLQEIDVFVIDVLDVILCKDVVHKSSF